MKKLIAILVVASQLNAADYYVHNLGSDSNGGSSWADSWATIGKATSVVSAGDTVYIGGTWTGTATITNIATSGNYTRWIGSSNVLGERLTIEGAYNEVTGISLTGGTATFIYPFRVENGADGTYLHGNTVTNKADGTHYHGGFWVGSNVGYPFNENAARDVIISNNVVIACSGEQPAFRFYGHNGLYVNNIVTNMVRGNGAYVFGTGNILRGNKFYMKETNALASISGHPDFLQTFGNNGEGSVSNIIEGNFFWGDYTESAENTYTNDADSFMACGQTQTGNGVFDLSGYTYDVSGQTNVDLFSSVFYEWVPGANDTSITVLGTNYTEKVVFRTGSGGGDIVTLFGTPETAVTATLGQFIAEDDPASVMGHWIIRNNVFANTQGSLSWAIPNSTFENNVFYRVARRIGAEVHPLTTGYLPYRNMPHNTTVRNNVFINCGNENNQAWYIFNSSLTNMVADYNFVAVGDTNAVPSGGSRSEYVWYEVNGINGGDPLLSSVDDLNFKPIYGSPLIDAGTTGPDNDIEGWSRSLGSAPDIGPYEFDPDLRLHFTFDGDISSQLTDATGYGHTGIKYNPTNFVIQIPGVIGSAGHGEVVGTAPLGYSNTWYAAVTNLQDIDFITNGTFSAWVRKGDGITQDPGHGNRWDTIVDGGYSPQYARVGAAATNSWTVSYGRSDLAEGVTTNFLFRVYGDSSLTNTLPNPYLQTGWPASPPDGETWTHLTATWEGGGDLILYFNGEAWSTNSLGLPWLRISGSPVTPWLAINTQTHDGTPEWGDDNYPNYGFLKGDVDDIRIYSRAIAADEVFNLYSINSANVSGSAPDPLPPAASGSSRRVPSRSQGGGASGVGL